MPWFGPNAWTALVQPVAGGGLPGTATGLELKFTFKEGGAPDFQSKFEAIKERLQQVVDNARESNASRNVDMANVHLDELPRYEDSGQDRRAPDQQQQRYSDSDEMAVPRQEAQVRRTSREVEEAAQRRDETPSDAPPGYEEAQQQSVQQELDRRLDSTR
ncbi:hypothetical protein LTR64_000305 [Lithohypha guttulata]|uniref:uncharacterized protein n=1 Tax=Lithohypha guttulata TaxID=1690604 RepID=UPI00315C9CC8